VHAPNLKFFASLFVEVDRPIEVGDVTGGLRRLIPIRSGTVVGDGWDGTILHGGADFQQIVSERRAEMDAKYVLEVPGGRIFVQNRAIRVAEPEVTRKLVQGIPVNPDDVYFRCTPIFETSIDHFKWIEERIFVGTGVRHPDSLELTFFEVS
jgi:hypothetical protein